MLSREQIASFHENGFLLIPSVLNPQRVKSLRESLRPLFLRPDYQLPAGDSRGFLFDVFNRYQETRDLLFHPTTLSVLRDLLGQDFVVIREASTHYQGFGGWHKDTTSQEAKGHHFQWEREYLFVEVAYYLQDNTSEYGGGLDVEIGSHRHADPFIPKPLSIVNRIMNRLRPRLPPYLPTPYSVPNKAGDLVIFDFRINHRATPQRVKPTHPDQEKIAVFVACARNNPKHIRAYHDFIASRADYVYLKDHAYAESLLAEARSAGITLA